VKYVFLALLGPGRTHGYELKRRYDALFAAVWGPVNIGQIYVTLGRLEKDGLVVQESVSQDGRPDRKDYELTDRGRAALHGWLGEADPVPMPKSDLVLKLVGASLLGTGDAQALIAEHRQRCFQALRDLDTASADNPADSVAGVLAHGAGLHLQAELQWLDHCDALLARGPLRLTTDPATTPGATS
jgi:DNA-binding PadR family transcriptional regulator